MAQLKRQPKKSILNAVTAWIMQKRIHQIELFKQYPHEVQGDVFAKLIDDAKDTEWGKQYDYQNIVNYDDYKRNVPISTYEQLEPWIDRCRKGESSVLWKSEIKWFAKSSGTTSSKSKYIPVSKDSLEDCHYKGGKDLLALYYQSNPESKLMAGKTLAMGGSQRMNEYNSQVYYDGDLSAILMKNLPIWVELKRVPNIQIALMDEWEEKLEKMANITLKHNVTNISGVPSWVLVLLRKVMELSNEDDISKIWPNLEVFFHGGVSFDPYREQFKSIISSSKMNYVETYNASEGFFGIQDDLSDKGMLLMLDYGVFYEFMPLEELGKEDPKTLQLDEVELGTNYAMVISTNGGLWRYLIGDTVKFTALGPYKIKVTGRTKSFINLVGEELMVENADQALKLACSKTNAMIKDYTAAPCFFTDDEVAGHEWVFEFEKEPSNLDYFASVFDNALKSVNSDYEAKRYQDMVLKMPIIHSVKSGVFHQWLKQQGRLGGQNKVPRLSNDRKYVEEICKLNI